MSKATTKDEVAATEPAEVQTLTLTEFCKRLSETVRRPELISAFEHRTRTSGVLRDTVEAFQSRYDVFVTTPV